MLDAKITEINYRNVVGTLLWTEPMIYKRLWKVGQDFVENHITYLVKRVSLADGIQHVNIEPIPDFI